MDVVEELIGWAFIGWMLVVLICAPLAWAWLMWDERRERRLERAQDEAIAIVRQQRSRDHHPVGKNKGPRGPEDDPRWIAWVRGRKN